jgi:eukaryotic-like serine/threonine-protein kinase
MREAPPDLIAALSPRYQLEREIGSGGMATVYLARDLKHERDVAIKVLRRDVAEAIGGDRFLGEIRTTAQLKHPHILPLFDSGSAGPVLFYVMPFIEGESLRARVTRLGSLPVAEVVRTLRQLADALAHAHGRGVIHRDVKSDNVLVSDRHVFLADFGIARALAAQAGQTATGTGLMVGTPGYMAPEQIVGGTIDHRTDVYGFGAVAYEMLAGTPPFTGHAQDVVAAQLTRPPETLTHLRPDTPPALAAMVMRCLRKDAGERWQRIDDLVAVLDSVDAPEVPLSPPHAPRRGNGWLAVAAVVAAAAIAVAWFASRTPRTTSRPLAIGRITHVTSDPGLELDPALSPDGRSIAYVAGPPGRMRIYVRQIDGGRSMALTEDTIETTAQRWPQWSSDGTRIVFQTGRPRVTARAAGRDPMLYQAPAGGGTARRILASPDGAVALSPAWSPDGTRIVYGAAGGLYTVPADGDGTAQRLIEGLELHSPRWSPDGTRIAYVKGGSIFTFGEEALGNVSTSTVMLATPGSGRVTALTGGQWLDTNPVWLPDNRTLLFVSSLRVESWRLA